MGFMIFGREDSNGAWEAYGGSLAKRLKRSCRKIWRRGVYREERKGFFDGEVWRRGKTGGWLCVDSGFVCANCLASCWNSPLRHWLSRVVVQIFKQLLWRVDAEEWWGIWGVRAIDLGAYWREREHLGWGVCVAGSCICVVSSNLSEHQKPSTGILKVDKMNLQRGSEERTWNKKSAVYPCISVCSLEWLCGSLVSTDQS